MRKLMACALSLSVAVFLSYYLLPLGWILPAAAGCAFAAAVLLSLRERSRAHLRCFLVLLGAALGFAVYSLHWHATLRYAEEWDGTVQNFPVTVLEAPEPYDRYTRLRVRRTEAPKLDLMLYDYRGLLTSEANLQPEPGQILAVTAKLRRADLRYGERNDSYVSKDISMTGTLQAMEVLPGRTLTLPILAARVSGRISDFADSFFSPDTRIFMRALMLGDKTDFYRDIPLYAGMRGAGFMHVVAISGMHIAFLVGLIQLLFGFQPASSVTGIVLVWFFVFMTGASPSAVRAGIMQTVLLMAPVLRRENDGPTSLSLALALILLLNPFSCASISLQMSFSAMAGMVLLSEPLTDALFNTFGLRPKSPLRVPVSVIGASLAVLIASAPVTVLHFGTLAVWSPLTNLLGMWAVSLCFCMGYLSCLAAQVFLPLGLLLKLMTEVLCRYLMMLVRLICRLPHHTVSMQRTEMLLWLLLCYLLAFVAWRWKSGGKLRVLLPAGLCVLSLVAALSAAKLRYRNAEGVAAVLDVGQGACVCLLSDTKTVMLDCGGTGTLNNAGETAANWLESAGRNRVDTLVLSHLHEDHCNGVPMLLELVPVRRIVLSQDADRDDALYGEVLKAAEAHGTEIILLTEDLTLQEGKISLHLFAPLASGDGNTPGVREEKDENERCLITLASVGEFDLLFTGDAPKSAELSLLERGQLPDTEVLVVGHHGSASATDGTFLDAIQAERAVISVGRNNSYGHPTREVLLRLQSRNMEIYRTDWNGTVEVVFSGQHSG